MGSIMSAIADDEKEWDNLRIKAKVLQYTKNVQVYSQEAALIQKGFEQYGLIGSGLINWVNAQLEADRILTDTRNKNQAIQAAISMLESKGYKVIEPI